MNLEAEYLPCENLPPGFLYGLSDMLYLAKRNIQGTLKEVEKLAIEFLEQYKNYPADHLYHWEYFDKKAGNSITDTE